MDIFALLNLAASKGASDLHLIASSPPQLRIDGSLNPIARTSPLTPENIKQAFNQLTSVKERADFRRNLELDFGYALPNVGRLRCNAAKHRGTIRLVIRLLPWTVPTLNELDLPEVCKELILKPRGLVVVSGPSGSGKSTTLSAMINYLNMSESRHIVTIEDPIEYLYNNDRCIITQRELGADTLSFAEALRHVLRQDPDIILVGEMRDLETAETVLTTAETGHLVLTTGHAPSAAQAVERIIDLFPPHERGSAQSRLASLLLGVLYQALIPKIDDSGRIVAVEIMLATPAIRNLIREGKVYQLPSIMQTQVQQGMVIFDQVLANLYLKGTISSENMFAFCNDRVEVERLCGRVEVR
jgi:twitching motility protein PilT